MLKQTTQEQAPAVRFQDRDVELRYRLGELTLLKRRFRMRVHLPPLDIRDAPAKDGAPDEDLPGDRQGVLFRSHPTAERLPRLARVGDFLRYVPHQFQRCFIDLETTFDEYNAKFSGKSRSTLRRKVKKFKKLSGGEIDFREYRTPEEAEEFYELARDLSRLTYQEQLLDAGLPEGEKFKAQMLDYAARDDLRAYLLFHEGKAVAYLFCPADEGVLAYAFLGYHPEYAKYSPGTVLQTLALERLFAEGRWKLFDFAEGTGAHKQFFSSGSRFCADIYFFRATLKNRFWVRLHAGVDAASKAIGNALKRLGIKKRVRDLVRRFGARKA